MQIVRGQETVFVIIFEVRGKSYCTEWRKSARRSIERTTSHRLYSGAIIIKAHDIQAQITW